MSDIEKRARELLAAESGWNVDDMVEHIGSDVCLFTADESLGAIRAALTPQWQPIKTAPMDGTRFLALTGSQRQRVDYKHQEVPASLFWQERPLDRYTHWMPLPAAPEQP